ncbi:hypothetical protein SCP_1202240 [Sparassis crispa]|uniref:Uncharacterized protein n=1 Tax=Sparassis crispa TaxID=139825 RepID=A0A401H0Q9_9APHY|nr:hypothetical protein SCP_1202240 [Sparassis crispa]GBE87998.1 hypothetical protein SCP_1202240 [Sparassis crispa]
MSMARTSHQVGSAPRRSPSPVTVNPSTLRVGCSDVLPFYQWQSSGVQRRDTRDPIVRRSRPAGEFMMDQSVSVRIRANHWVIGVIVGILHMCHKYANVGYEIQYSIDGRLCTDTFAVDDMRRL